MPSAQAKSEFFKMISANIRRELDPDDFELGVPVARPIGLNTEISIVPYHSSHWYTNRVMRYNRADLAGPYMVIVQRNAANTLYDLLDQINFDPIFQINQRPHPEKDLVSVAGVITQDDVYNVELPAQAGRAYITVPMVAKPESLFLLGSLHVRILKDN